MRYKKSGFSLIELIMVLGVTAILMGIVGFNFAKERKKGNLTRATQNIGQDIRFARSKALSQSTNWRINPVNHNQYLIEEQDPNTNNWVIRRRRSLPGSAHLASQTVAGSITFDSRGFADISPVDLEILITNDNKTQKIITSMTGSLLIMDAEDN